MRTLNIEEVSLVAGGWEWDSFGATILTGAAMGALGALATGPGGVLVGAATGALMGAGSYAIHDTLMWYFNC